MVIRIELVNRVKCERMFRDWQQKANRNLRPISLSSGIALFDCGLILLTTARRHSSLIRGGGSNLIFTNELEMLVSRYHRKPHAASYYFYFVVFDQRLIT